MKRFLVFMQVLMLVSGLNAQTINYSYCGYKASEEPIPHAGVKAVVQPVFGDATLSIQAAIDYVSSLPVGEDGLRGAVLLEKGTYVMSGGLKIAASGVVLRGCGEKTILLGTGDDRTTMIRIAGRLDRKAGPVWKLADSLPAGAIQLKIQGHPFKPGDCLRITRRGTQEWIDRMDMNDFGGESKYIGWKPGDDHGRPGDVDVHWDRTVTAVEGDVLTLDAPLTCDIAVNEGSISSYEWPGRITDVGVEDLHLVSLYDERYPKDENHRWMAIEIDNMRDGWVTRVISEHFAGSSVIIADNASRVTVEGCRNLSPVSELGGQRRNAFFTMGGQTLFLRCYSEEGMHDFSTGRNTPGPTAFVQCQAVRPNHISGTIDSWATGVLFEDFRTDGVLAMSNRGQDGMGAGYTAAYSTLWNCQAEMIACTLTPTAPNWAYGAKGQTVGNVEFQPAKDYGLFESQLKQRTGHGLLQAEAMADASDNMTADGITADMYTIWEGMLKSQIQVIPQKMHLQDGVLVRDGKILTGRSRGITWWNGSLRERYTVTAGSCITRYAPGRVGNGFTDDLDEMTDNMVASHTLVTNHHYGLWYDRRRDDHERIRRMDGCVWPPFYEQPFARSGEGSAFDGLSKYDLTRWNVWYWNRLKKYADLADQKGLVLYHQHYFQHNIIEAGAHWADCPWRSANNINETGFPEPVPYANDKRVYMAEQFYDVTDTTRFRLYRNYIRKSLEEFADNGSVIHFIGEEFTGPLHFVQFWLDVIAEWEAETGRHPLIALSTTKDVQDAILADPARAAVVDIIDIKYWNPSGNGMYYAPPGGVSLAPRQYQRLRGNPFVVKSESTVTGKGDFVYETVADYHNRFPEKAILYSAMSGNQWAPFMAGASLCSLPSRLPEHFLETVSEMHPMESTDRCWIMGKPGTGYVAYPLKGEVTLDLSKDKTTYTAQWLSLRGGEPVSEPFTVKGGKNIVLPSEGILWLYR